MKKYNIYVTNPNGIPRVNEPIEVKLDFEQGAIYQNFYLENSLGEKIPFQMYDEIYQNNRLNAATLVFISSFDKDSCVYSLINTDEKYEMENMEGIKSLDVTQEDGFTRLDTGYYELELCSGKADGTASGKWGIRFFENIKERKNLIKDYSNAIGGFYGPFFTPKNGLINPPEHVKVEIRVEVVGPLYHRYRFIGKIPNGLDEKLFDKSFEIIWEFYYKSPIFRRQYIVDDFETVVDGMPVVNKITVGDEFESGQGELVFNKFLSYGTTTYREGDLYANILADNVKNILLKDDENVSEAFKAYKDSIGENINEVSWDYFWKMFCSQENLLSNDEIKNHVNQILPAAHRITHLGKRNVDIKHRKSVEVNAVPEQTIFPLTSNKTCELNETTGYSMIWYTNNLVNRFQIVQRKESGWVNWGTNGENEYPELPVGSIIKTAYGKFDDWESFADTLEKPLIGYFSLIEGE